MNKFRLSCEEMAVFLCRPIGWYGDGRRSYDAFFTYLAGTEWTSFR